jgi:hypothetical protein
MQSTRLFLGAVALCAFSITYPSFGQAPQDRSAPQTRPAPGNGARPQPDKGRPGGGNNDRPQIQPVRPNPGNPPPRPNPGKPNPPRPNPPGNNRPPARPNPGRPPTRPQPGRPGGHKPGPRPPQWGHRPPNRPSYGFRPNDRSYLHRYYLSRLGLINRGFRVHIVVGGFFPYADIPYITPLPADVYASLPPPPPGYDMGYYEGYVVVYDPFTFYIADVIDLLQY